MIATCGAVLGVDIGFLVLRSSGAVCCLRWDDTQIAWTIRRFRYDPEERRNAIRAVAGKTQVFAAAFDGPFRADLTEIGLYRLVERILTRKIALHVGKPGPSHVPVGRALNRATNEAVADVLELSVLSNATHAGAVHERAVVEAFPNTFLGAMLPQGHALAKGRANRSDRYFVFLAASGVLATLLESLLPGRTPVAAFESVTNHDDRAALVCALSALCVVAGRYVMVGDDDGRIVLPPTEFWNPSLLSLLRENCGSDSLIERS